MRGYLIPSSQDQHIHRISRRCDPGARAYGYSILSSVPHTVRLLRFTPSDPSTHIAPHLDTQSYRFQIIFKWAGLFGRSQT